MDNNNRGDDGNKFKKYDSSVKPLQFRLGLVDLEHISHYHQTLESTFLSCSHPQLIFLEYILLVLDLID